MQFNILDWVLLIYIGFSAIRGLVRGFLVEIGGIVAALIAIFFSPRAYSLVEPFVPRRIPGNWGEVIAFFVIFIVSLVIVGRFLKLLTKGIPAVPLGCLNTLAGGVLGFARSVFISGIILAVLLKFPVANTQKLISDSKLSSRILTSSKAVYPFLPKSFRTQLEQPERSLSIPRKGITKD
ncbi:MAG: CvpA family protein [Candidatus Eisenbacteria bacterium]|nr:CvpA family protein [Candidatus Eisenbacteria bacterium]